jgi:hypothetical protein
MASPVFVLSPASCSGRRGRQLLSPTARSPWAHRLAAGELSLGETFAFMSGLYFRGKLEYARHFGASDAVDATVLIITPTRGLQHPDTLVTRELLIEFAGVDLATAGERYLTPLVDAARALNARLAPQTRVVLLGSVATAKYLVPLSQALGGRLCFPSAFVGRGDMSRGGLLLRSVSDDRELDYVPFEADVVRRGARPPRLDPRPGILARMTRL